MRVIVESPFHGDFKNVKYAREAVRDCLSRGESPFASHLLYTQKGLLDDKNPTERKRGIDAAMGWLEVADYVAVYMDLGVTPGMVVGIVRATQVGKSIKLRWIRNQNREVVVDASDQDPRVRSANGPDQRDRETVVV